MKILSLFDGISIAQQAFKNLGIPVDKYYASEIDKYTISITRKNFPDTIMLGDVEQINGEGLSGIDLIIGGSPCTNLSSAGKREGLKGDQSRLFYDFVRLVKEVKPRYFILENVYSMSHKNRDLMTEALFNVEPTMIDASLVSAQSRRRYFWIGKLVGDTYERVDVGQPKDKGILLKDILQDEVDEKYYLKDSSIKNLNYVTNPVNIKKKFTQVNGDKALPMTARQFANWRGTYVKPDRIGHLNKGGQGQRIYSSKGKSISLTAYTGGPGGKTGLYEQHSRIRKLTPIECERLQSLPDNYTALGMTDKGQVKISNTQRYKALGNGFNCKVIEHIIKLTK